MYKESETEAPSVQCEHEWVVDPDDKRFKICMLCEKVEYRTDNDVTTGVQSKGWKEMKHGRR